MVGGGGKLPHQVAEVAADAVIAVHGGLSARLIDGVAFGRARGGCHPGSVLLAVAVAGDGDGVGDFFVAGTAGTVGNRDDGVVWNSVLWVEVLRLGDVCEVGEFRRKLVNHHIGDASLLELEDGLRESARAGGYCWTTHVVGRDQRGRHARLAQPALELAVDLDRKSTRLN